MREEELSDLGILDPIRSRHVTHISDKNLVFFLTMADVDAIWLLMQ